jgi:hypothetical protein
MGHNRKHVPKVHHIHRQIEFVAGLGWDDTGMAVVVDDDEDARAEVVEEY